MKGYNPDLPLEQWLAYRFADPSPERPDTRSAGFPWRGRPECVVVRIAETFENSAALLAPYSDEQLSSGLRYLIDNDQSDAMLQLRNANIDGGTRLRALRSMFPLFRDTMAARCSPRLSFLNPGGGSLNSLCFMWWDVIPLHGKWAEAPGVNFGHEVIATMRQILDIPHDACRESALHGLGHWQQYYPSVSAIIDKFLCTTRNLRPELVSYARMAREGAIQ
jgi:hypothetical protein